MLVLGRHIKAILFDLDDTLYRCHELNQSVVVGIRAFMVKHLGYNAEEVVDKATALYVKYGTTLAGLVEQGCKVDIDQWHKEVHWGQVRYEDLLHPDPALRAILMALDDGTPRYVFTNADKEHARICLERLGIQDCFQGVYHFENLHELATAAGLEDADHPHVICKPAHKAYNLLFDHLGVKAEEVLFFDDSVRNIRAATELGVLTVLVGTDQATEGADVVMPDLHHLSRLLRTDAIPVAPLAVSGDKEELAVAESKLEAEDVAVMVTA